MKKLLAVLLALVMVMSMTACVTDEGPEETRASLTPPPAVEKAPERKNADFYPIETDTVLRVLYTEDGLGDTDASRLWEELTGIQVDNLTWTNEQMFTSLAAGDIPDAIVMPWNFTKEKVYEFGAAGKFLDFSKHLDKMPNLCALIKENPEILEVCGYPDGAMYSLPQVSWSNTYQSNLLYYRTDMLEEMGWDHTPASADEFLQFIKEAQAKYGATNPEFVAFMPQQKTYMNWTGTNTISATFFPAFGELVETKLTLNKDKEVVLGAATEQYRYYLEFMNEIWESGAFGTEIYTMESTASKALVQNGNCAISIGTHAMAAAFPDGVVDVEVMAPITSKYQGVKQWMRVPNVNFRACVANANCEDLDTLLAFLDSFYISRENPLNKEGTVWGYSIVKGVEGTNWTIDDEAKTWTGGAAFSNYYDALFGGLGDNSGVNDYTPLSNLQIKGQGTNKNLIPYEVFVPNLQNKVMLSEDDQMDYADIWADMEKYISQMHDKFITGAEDIETGWDNYLSQLNKMGLEEILEMYQDAYEGK